VDCKWTGWSTHWIHRCSQGRNTCGPGRKFYTRSQSPAAAHGGKACSGGSTEQRPCLVANRHCPIDCKWSSWTQYSPSSCPACGGGKKKRTRNRMGPYHGGARCHDESITATFQVCDTTPACKINCDYGSWGSWTTCSVSCGMGMSQRSRDKLHSAAYGGEECSGQALETKDCIPIPYCPIDCVVAEWEAWSRCSQDCGGGQMGRHREKLVPDQHNGAVCPHLLESLECNKDTCEEAAATMHTISVAIFLLVILGMIPYAEREA